MGPIRSFFRASDLLGLQVSWLSLRPQVVLSLQLQHICVPTGPRPSKADLLAWSKLPVHSVYLFDDLAGAKFRTRKRQERTAHTRQFQAFNIALIEGTWQLKPFLLPITRLLFPSVFTISVSSFSRALHSLRPGS